MVETTMLSSLARLPAVIFRPRGAYASWPSCRVGGAAISSKTALEHRRGAAGAVCRGAGDRGALKPPRC
eukprot:252817-Chlamydomonas_euryale.AAC.2